MSAKGKRLAEVLPPGESALETETRLVRDGLWRRFYLRLRREASREKLEVPEWGWPYEEGRPL